jgi:hypothetical protein
LFPNLWPEGLALKTKISVASELSRRNSLALARHVPLPDNYGVAANRKNPEVSGYAFVAEMLPIDVARLPVAIVVQTGFITFRTWL